MPTVSIIVTTRFYPFVQNNSGGRYRLNLNNGIAHNVIIEAKNYREANAKAEEIGMAFDMSDSCECCGSRWSEQWGEQNGTEEPKLYDQTLKEFYTDPRGWFKDSTTVVHYYDGTVKIFTAKDFQ